MFGIHMSTSIGFLGTAVSSHPGLLANSYSSAFLSINLVGPSPCSPLLRSGCGTIPVGFHPCIHRPTCDIVDSQLMHRVRSLRYFCSLDTLSLLVILGPAAIHRSSMELGSRSASSRTPLHRSRASTHLHKRRWKIRVA